MAKAFNKITFIVSKLRHAWLQSPERTEALREAMIQRGQYECASCGGVFKRHQLQVDHIQPVRAPGWKYKDGRPNWNTFINRLFCGPQGYQCLCKMCHQKKTNKERKK